MRNILARMQLLKREILVNFTCKAVNMCDIKRYTRYIQCVVFHLYAIRRINRCKTTIKIVIMQLSVHPRPRSLLLKISLLR